MDEVVTKRRRITPETRRLIASLLKQGLTASEVVAALWGDGLTISITPVTQEAYKLGIKLRSGPRKGMLRIGRPPLHGSPGTPYSKKRKAVMDLAAAGEKPRQIAKQLGMTPAGVYRLLSDESKRNAAN